MKNGIIIDTTFFKDKIRAQELLNHFSSDIGKVLDDTMLTKRCRYAPDVLPPSLRRVQTLFEEKLKVTYLTRVESGVFYVLIDVDGMTKNQRVLKSFLKKLSPIMHKSTLLFLGDKSSWDTFMFMTSWIESLAMPLAWDDKSTDPSKVISSQSLELFFGDETKKEILVRLLSNFSK